MTLDSPPTVTSVGMRSVTKLLHARPNDRLDDSGRDQRFSTGTPPLDEAVGGGFRRRDLVLIAGGPGAGKTILALQWARAAAMQGARAIYVSYGYNEADLLARFTTLEFASAQRDAMARIGSYGSHLHLVAASGRYTDIDAIERLVPDQGHRETVLFVDYLQRIPTRGMQFASDDDRVGYLAESLKELALRRNVAVVAVAAVDKDALSKPRFELQDVQGPGAVLYEADIVLMLNVKARASSQRHLARDVSRAELATRNVIVSVEKNRNGVAGNEVEFGWDSTRLAVHPDASCLTPHLVDDVVVVE